MICGISSLDSCSRLAEKAINYSSRTDCVYYAGTHLRRQAVQHMSQGHNAATRQSTNMLALHYRGSDLVICKQSEQERATRENTVPAVILYNLRKYLCAAALGLRKYVVRKRERTSAGNISTQYFSHWKGTCEDDENEVQSMIMSNIRFSYAGAVNVCSERSVSTCRGVNRARLPTLKM